MPTVPVSIHLPRPGLREAGIAVHRIGRVLMDSTRTLDLLHATEILAQEQLRALLRAGVFETDEGRALLRDRPHLADTDVDMLRGLPSGSLGHAFASFLDEHGLDPKLLRQPTPYTSDPDAAYLMTRVRETHDLWHTLLGLGTEGYEEVLVHAFSLAQTGLPGSLAVVTLGGVKHVVLERRWQTLRRGLRRAHRIGRGAEALVPVYWERRWEKPLEEVRREFGIEPYPSPDSW